MQRDPLDICLAGFVSGYWHAVTRPVVLGRPCCARRGLVDIEVCGAFTDVGFTKHVRAPSDNDECVLDLSDATFVDPFGLVVLAALVEDARRADRAVLFRPPKDDDCATYLHRMGFADVLDSYGIAHRLAQVRRHDTGDRLLELCRFGADFDAADRLAAHVFRIFNDDQPALARELYNSVSEIANNVVEHSGASGGFVALQQFRGSLPRPQVSFAIADSGAGLAATLRRTHTVRDDAHALTLAVQRHVTSTGVWGRGAGLYALSHRTRYGGRLQLMSGSYAATFRRGRAMPTLSAQPDSFAGTAIHVRIVHNGGRGNGVT